MRPFAFLMIVGVLLCGCNTASELRAASTKGVANSYSCGQINAAFNAYEADRTSVAAMKQVATTSGIEFQQIPQVDVASYYESAKAAANVALIMQGCQPRS